MKMKIQPAEESVKMDSKLYNMFVDLIQDEYNKMSVLASAKIYFMNNGFIKYKKFISEIFKKCTEFKWSLETYLAERMEEVPEFKIPALNYEFDSAEEPFEVLSKAEDLVYGKLLEAMAYANNIKDNCAFSFLIMKVNDSKSHIMCKAHAAVTNKQDPNDLLECK